MRIATWIFCEFIITKKRRRGLFKKVVLQGKRIQREGIGFQYSIYTLNRLII